MKAEREELGRLVANAAFLKPFGFVLQSCASGECTLVAPYAVSLERPGGILSGITLMAAADVAMWVAIGLASAAVAAIVLTTTAVPATKIMDILVRCISAPPS